MNSIVKQANGPLSKQLVIFPQEFDFMSIFVSCQVEVHITDHMLCGSLELILHNWPFVMWNALTHSIYMKNVEHSPTKMTEKDICGKSSK